MKSFGLCALIAFSVSGALIPLTVSISQRLGAVSETGGRHVGQNPIGRLGGMSVTVGITVAIALLWNFNSSFEAASRLQSHQLIGLMFGALLVGGVGFWDDFQRISAKLKLLVHILAAILVYISGLTLSSIDLPFIKPLELGWLAFPITILWIIGVVNAVNLIDGLDGLAGGVVLFASLVNFVAATTNNSVIPAGIMAAVAGGVLGFLMFNWHPAKIYLGDGGAYTLGFLLATSALFTPDQKASTSVAFLVPVLASGLPIIDALLTIVRRTLNRRGIFTPDRGHLHHILLDSGISHRRVVIGLYVISCLLGSIAVAVVVNRNRTTGCFLVAASLAALILWSCSVRKSLTAVVGRFVIRIKANTINKVQN